MKNVLEKNYKMNLLRKEHEHSCNFLLINLEKKCRVPKPKLEFYFFYNKNISSRTFACSNWGFSENLTEITFHNNKLDKSFLQGHFQWIWRSKGLGGKNQIKKDCSRKNSFSILWKTLCEKWKPKNDWECQLAERSQSESLKKWKQGKLFDCRSKRTTLSWLQCQNLWKFSMVKVLKM